MKIIKRGENHGERKAQWYCSSCKSIIESKANEGTYVYDLRDGDAIKFACPVCNHTNWVAASKFNG